jgi:hypothetical protein
MKFFFPVLKLYAFCFLFMLFSINSIGQIGINTSDPKTTLDVNGALALREGGNIENVPNKFHNLILGANPHSVYRITGPSNADFEISGIFPAPGADGQLLVFVNGTSGKMTVLNDSNLSDPGNKIYVPGGRDLTLTGNFSTLMLLYNKDLNGGHWVVLNKSSHIEVRSLDVASLASGPTVLRLPVPEATNESSASVSFVGHTLITSAVRDKLFVEYVEVRNGEVWFRVRNDGALLSPVMTNPIKFSIIINII